MLDNDDIKKISHVKTKERDEIVIWNNFVNSKHLLQYSSGNEIEF